MWELLWYNLIVAGICMIVLNIYLNRNYVWSMKSINSRFQNVHISGEKKIPLIHHPPSTYDVYISSARLLLFIAFCFFFFGPKNFVNIYDFSLLAWKVLMWKVLMFALLKSLFILCPMYICRKQIRNRNVLV